MDLALANVPGRKAFMTWRRLYEKIPRSANNLRRFGRARLVDSAVLLCL